MTEPINTYSAMNDEIAKILRMSGEQPDLYAAQYIEELQAKIEQLEAEVERLRSEPERVLAYVYESLTKEPWDASRGPLTANCLWIEIGKWIDQARAENERLRAQIVETEATAER
jgi:cell division protein FtsB